MTVSDGFPAWLKAGVELQTRMMMGAFGLTPLGMMQGATRHYRREVAANRARLNPRVTRSEAKAAGTKRVQPVCEAATLEMFKPFFGVPRRRFAPPC